MADGVDIDLYADDIEHDFKQVKGIFRINMADIDKFGFSFYFDNIFVKNGKNTAL